MSAPHNMLHVAQSRYNVVVPTRYGMMIVNRNDWKEGPDGRYGVGHDLLDTGEFQQPELEAIADLVRQCPPDPVLLDIGANIGVHTLWLSELAGPRGRVLAFEPQRIVFQMLLGNLALGSVENVLAHHLALGGAAGELALPAMDYRRPDNFGGVSLAGGAGLAPGEAVAVAALDSFNLQRVDFIKMDVEGMEEEVLRGASRTLDRTRPLMQVEWTGGNQGRLPIYLIERLDYRVFQAGMNLTCIPAEKYSETGIAAELTMPAIRAAFRLS